jgi:phage tail-like protein
MIFNSFEGTCNYIKTLLDKNVKVYETDVKKICSINNINIDKIVYVEGESNKAILKDIKILDNNSISLIYSKRSWIDELPSLYQDNEFLKRFIFGFQKSHQDIECKIDTVSEQFSASKTEFLQWLSSWVGISFSEDVNEDSQRKVLSDIIRLYKIRGTKEYFVDLVKYLTQVNIRIDDSPKSRVLHHNLISKVSNEYIMTIYIDEIISQDEKIENQKLSIIRSIFEKEKPINVDFKIVYQNWKCKNIGM